MIKNYTPHSVKIGEREFPSEGLARVAQTDVPTGEVVDGVEIRRPQFGRVEGLPEQEADTLYIVSALVKAACPERNDLVSPGGFTRDDAGRITGASYLLR